MGKTDVAVRVDDAVQRHAAQFKKLHLLSVFLGNQVVRVRQTNKRNAFILPILLKGRQRIGANRQDFHTAACKLFILITQARQLRAAVGSHKTTQEGKQDRLPTKIR